MAGDWWYCLRDHKVEHGPGCPNMVRLGPYETEQEAATASERAAERSEAWDHDPNWTDEARAADESRKKWISPPQ